MTISRTAYDNALYSTSLPVATTTPLNRTSSTYSLSSANGFASVLAQSDSVNISSGVDGTSDAQILAYEQRMESDHSPGFTLFSRDLTSTDKAMLSQLQGGSWQSNGPANHLVDQIATARTDGALTGAVTADFIENIVKSQQAGIASGKNQVSIPQSVLDEALSWINSDNQVSKNQ